jgi:hypothetical protein
MSQQPVISSRRPSSFLGKRLEESFHCRNARMVLALADLPQASVIERYFQEGGWNVFLAASGCEARRLARRFGASAVLLAEEPPNEESGWLTSWKLLRDRPKVRVVVIGRQPAEWGRRFAEFVGAAGYVNALEPVASVAGVLDSSEVF